MILQAFSVFDHKVAAFMQPFFTRSKGEAIRSFSDACLNEQHQFAKHREDYVLMFVGEFDDMKGVFRAVDTPVPVLAALEVVPPPAEGR